MLHFGGGESEKSEESEKSAGESRKRQIILQTTGPAPSFGHISVNLTPEIAACKHKMIQLFDSAARPYAPPATGVARIGLNLLTANIWISKICEHTFLMLLA